MENVIENYYVGEEQLDKKDKGDDADLDDMGNSENINVSKPNEDEGVDIDDTVIIPYLPFHSDRNSSSSSDKAWSENLNTDEDLQDVSEDNDHNQEETHDLENSSKDERNNSTEATDGSEWKNEVGIIDDRYIDDLRERKEYGIQVCKWENMLFKETAESLDCDMCSVEGKITPSYFYCFDCEIYLCGGCQKWHKKLESSVNHSCMHKDEIDGRMQVKRKEGDNKGKPENVWNPTNYEETEVTIDRKSICGPCVYGGKHMRAFSVCLDCLEYLCSACNKSHLGMTTHKIIRMDEWYEKDILKEVIPVYKDNCYKELFERVAPGTIQRQSTLPEIEDKRYYHVSSFSTRIFEDLQYPQLTGITFTLDGRILVCDRNNEKLKLFSQELKPLASIEIPKVADLTIIDKITTVCSVPDSQQLAFIDIKNGLKLLNYINTSVKYWGLDYLNHELFALTIPDKSTPSCVHMLDIAGHVISIIYPSCSLADRSVAKYPKYLTVSPSGGTIYVTDTNNRVIALGLDGRVIFERDSEEIRGVHGLVTDDRNVYVCLEEACCLLRVTLDGGHSTVALGHKDHLDSPCCVAMDTTHTKMIISELHTSIVQVYEV